MLATEGIDSVAKQRNGQQAIREGYVHGIAYAFCEAYRETDRHL